MAHVTLYLSMTGKVPADWPVMIHYPDTGSVMPGGLVACGKNLIIWPRPMTVGQVRDVAAHLPPGGFIVTADGGSPRQQRTEFVIEHDRGRVVVGGWDWVTRDYLSRHGEKPDPCSNPAPPRATPPEPRN